MAGRTKWGSFGFGSNGVLDASRTPDFGRRLQLKLEEAELLRRCLRSSGMRSGTMLDVGAHRGTVTRLFASKGWTVYAFEPDSENRQRFREAFDGHPTVVLDSRAVGESDGDVLPFFTSHVSTGISSLIPFHPSHDEAAEVVTVRLDTFLRERGVQDVDVIKVDTEGFDLFVLRSFPWEQMDRPSAILCEFENAKTTLVGYSTVDLAEYLLARGYSVLVSEWHPVSQYGAQHSWRRMYPWRGDDVLSDNSWGNLLAFRDQSAAERAVRLAPELISSRTPGGPLRRLFNIWRQLGMMRNNVDSPPNEPTLDGDRSHERVDS